MGNIKSPRQRFIHTGIGIAFGALLGGTSVALGDETNDVARYSDQPAPLALQGFPERPPPLLELGDKFLSTGNLQNGITLPTGEVISPNFWVFGTLRSAIQTFDTGNGADSRTTEWVNRLDIFGNLQFSPTERFLIGFRPLDRVYSSGRDEFSGYRFEPSASQGWTDGVNGTPTTFFFEGELGEMFPTLDEHDKKSLDYGFAVGRQPLTLQDGLLANTYEVDMVSVTRNSLLIPGGSTMRLSGLFGWNQIQRPDYSTANVANVTDPDALFVGLDGAVDFPVNTLEADLLYEFSSQRGDAFYAGIGSIQRLGMLNSTVRAVASVATKGQSSKASTGGLLLGQLSYTIPATEDFLYLDAYWGIDRFSSLVRDPTAGGPLGAVGLLWAAVGLGNYGAPLSNVPDYSAGAALGYQMFLGKLNRQQLIFELGGRVPTQTPTLARQDAAGGVAARYQRAFGRRFVLVLDAFCVAHQYSRESYGVRMEWDIKL